MAVTRLFFKIPTQSSTTTYTLDLARELSKHHRTLIRQKQLFTVYGGIYQDSDNSNAYFSTAPHYWVTKSAINRGFKAWKKQLSDTMQNHDFAEGSSSQLKTSKYNDFKIVLDSSHNASATSSNTLPSLDASGIQLPSGEWSYSTLTRPRPDQPDSNGVYHQFASDQFVVQIVGDHVSSGTSDAQGDLNYSRVSLIKSWLNSRPTKDNNDDSPLNQPNLDADPIFQMFVVGDSDEDQAVIDVINDQNDTPPYDMDKLYGHNGESADAGLNLQMQCIVSPDTNSGVASVAGFQALCGLVRLEVTGGTGSTGASLILDVESNGVGF